MPRILDMCGSRSLNGARVCERAVELFASLLVAPAVWFAKRAVTSLRRPLGAQRASRAYSAAAAWLRNPGDHMRRRVSWVGQPVSCNAGDVATPKVIRRDTMPLTLEVPREFANFCAARGITPERVLSTFFADLCNLTNLFGCPREDGYTGSGNAEQALDYFNHTWGDAHHPTLRNKRGTNQRRTRKDT